MNKKNIKVRDLKPSKDAKGGGGGPTHKIQGGGPTHKIQGGGGGGKVLGGPGKGNR